jgi:hypothetical protein
MTSIVVVDGIFHITTAAANGHINVVPMFSTKQRRGPAPPGGEEPLDSVSHLFSSRDFSYLIKTTKI